MAQVRYIGKGAFIPGIPAVLNEDEVKRIGLKRLIESGLYEEVKPPKPKRIKVEKPEEPIEVEESIEEDNHDTRN